MMRFSPLRFTSTYYTLQLWHSLPINAKATQKALTRSEVSGGGRKPWRQKGTGHARQGSIRAPQWKGGGVVFAPTPRDYTTTMNKKEKRAALKAALSNAVAENKLIVVDEIRFDEIKTKNFQNMLNVSCGKHGILIIFIQKNESFLHFEGIQHVLEVLGLDFHRNESHPLQSTCSPLLRWTVLHEVPLSFLSCSW